MRAAWCREVLVDRLHGGGWGAAPNTDPTLRKRRPAGAPTFETLGRGVPSDGPGEPGSVPLPSLVQLRGGGADEGPRWQG